MNENLELTPGPAVQYLLADDTVAVRYRLRFTARASGQGIEMSLMHRQGSGWYVSPSRCCDVPKHANESDHFHLGFMCRL
jgi:hypothetical protein